MDYFTLAITPLRAGVARFDPRDLSSIAVQWHGEKKEVIASPRCIIGTPASTYIAHITFMAMRCLPYISHGFSDPILRSIATISNTAREIDLPALTVFEVCETAFNLSSEYGFRHNLDPGRYAQELMNMLIDMAKRENAI